MPRRLALVAVVAGLSFLVHGANHLRRGEAHDLLWMCNLAPLLLAVGCVLRVTALVGVATLWLSFGTPMWLADLATGGEVIATSFLPHLVCPVVAVLAVRELGLPRRAWLVATVAMLGLFAVTRILTSPEPNVNLAFSVWKGWEATFPRYDHYFVLVVSGSALTFAVVERALRHWVVHPRASSSATDAHTPEAA